MRPVAIRQAMPEASARAIAPAVRSRRLERLIEHGAVEIHRDCAHRARVEARRQVQHVRSAGYLPATDATYAATFAASAPVSSFGGMAPPPFSI